MTVKGIIKNKNKCLNNTKRNNKLFCVFLMNDNEIPQLKSNVLYIKQ